MTDPAAQQPVAGAARCPRCGADLAPEQEWCLDCGTAARTAIAAPPNWRLPVALIAVAVALAGAAVAWALVELTENDAEVRAATTPVITKTVQAPAPGAQTTATTITSTATSPVSTAPLPADPLADPTDEDPSAEPGAEPPPPTP